MTLSLSLRTFIAAGLSACCFNTALAESMTVTRPTDLKSERYLDASTVLTLAAGQAVESLKLEAGWVQVKVGNNQGWVRAMALSGAGTASVANVAKIESGRSGNNNNMSTTGIRSIPKASRHALIIGVGEYAASGISTLQGVKKDIVSARSMGMAMSIPDSNIEYLRDKDATAEQIRQSLKDLNARVRPGDRVFVYYSGHGTRWVDPQTGPDACTEGLLATDGQAITNLEMSNLLSPIASKSDKLMVFYDACHSGGIANQPMKTRSLQQAGLSLTPKFVSQISPEQCAKPANMRTRSLSSELSKQGAVPENIVSIAASRPDEVSFDDPQTGGLATSAWRDCMLGGAKDLDNSGAISVEEITRCAQEKVSKTLSRFPDILGQQMTIGGNRGFVPAFFTAPAAVAATLPEEPTPATSPSATVMAPAPAPVAAASTPSSAVATPPAAATLSSTSVQPTLPNPSTQAASPADLLKQVHEQRDASRALKVQATPAVLRINQDPLQLSITSPLDGYLYIALAGSDKKSLYLLYPNAVDGNNAIQANQTVTLPRPHWRITAGGPKGVDTVLVMVSDSPRDLSSLRSEKAGPFVKPLLSATGKSQLQLLLGNSENGDQSVCQQGGKTRNLIVSQACSDAFASTLLNIEER
ncbi:caspase family protein [Limnohabitans sp.]|uniref:caspase family protein n=1 Tax=Limnohabitans sp. TaxID=1907725 RepID=UPI0038B88654